MASKVWTDEKIKDLKKLLASGNSVKEAAKKLKASQDSVGGAIRRYSLKIQPVAPAYIPIELENKTINIDKIKKDNSLRWEIKKSNKTNIKNKNFKSYLVIGDIHIPFQNDEAIKSVLSLMDDQPFDGIVILGDFMDMTPISHWLHEKSQNKSLENKRMLSDYAKGNVLLDEIDKRLPAGCDKHFFMGNHERFYNDLIEKYPALEGLLEPATELKLKERGYKIYPVNHIEWIGKLAFCHGMFHSQNYVRAHIQAFKTNVIHADMHSPQMCFDNSPAKELAIAGYCIGCLCNTNPEYMQNRPNKWSHGFGIMYLYQSGDFDLDLKRIVKGKFVYNNKMYDGNK